MNHVRAWIRNFFGFSRTETNAFVVMIPLMILLIASEPVTRWWATRYPPSIDTRALDSLVAACRWETQDTLPPPLFAFDPNTAREEMFDSLGLDKHLVRRIIRYRDNGGTFKTKHDFAKIYGLDSALYERLAPFIQLQNIAKPTYRTTRQEIKPFDLNLADTSQLITLRGIGSKRASTIVRYRNRLGGFISVDQLNEVFGLDSSSLATVKTHTFVSDSFAPHRININTADEKELAAQPYIRIRLAKAITTYRIQHGTYSQVDELRKIATLDSVLFQRIKPYLTVKD